MFPVEDGKMRGIITIIMAAAIGMILLALTTLGIFFHQEVERARTQAAAVQHQLTEAQAVILAEQRRVADGAVARQKAIDDAVQAVTAAQTAAINAQFDRVRAANAAEHAREIAELKRLQDELTRKIQAIVQGPPGPAGAPGTPGSPGQPGNCKLVCL